MSEKQTPQPVEKTENAMEIMEPKEAWIRLHTQEVRGSSPCAPTNTFRDLRSIRAVPRVDFWVHDLLLFLWISVVFQKSGHTSRNDFRVATDNFRVARHPGSIRELNRSRYLRGVRPTACKRGTPTACSYFGAGRSPFSLIRHSPALSGLSQSSYRCTIWSPAEPTSG